MEEIYSDACPGVHAEPGFRPAVAALKRGPLRWPVLGLSLLLSAVLAGCRHVPRVAAPAPTAPAAAGVFRDRAQEAGLNYRWGHGGKSPLTILDTIGHA